ncbi:mRNA interferase MazF [Candidatus Hakubella thermalkaliphila]|uniref:mRNA interferase MazF n=3 Tax=Candidatus Hakubella thermalkaliphila TaxID=2754717 RepID=A0A6V8Q4I7_9ACTN|nr:type II toxin-antitoxin system PemK/MazF family toxin [Candidatus Hakubella thermalkaliphila]GFP26641.1 mRNA interferase MazF [Candidatus Hakubella thermalkaliphila]GFP34561.1 mRNA interferase MazF [Candidatus Hakubella thermalkaliphila]GFP39675.1 mRNA interferase MazF [Candidatus Hakubella thermalkaliphila]
MSKEQTFCRGDVVLVSFPYVTEPTRTKVRPAVIIQNNVGNRFSPNLIVAAISSQLPRREYPPNLIVRQDSPEAEGTGLDGDSVIQAEVILTVPKTSVVKRLGQFNDVTMRAIDQCVKVSLGL